MPRNGLPPHCSWEIDRHGKRRIRFRWRKVFRSITGTPGEAKQQARQQQNDLASEKRGGRKQDRKTRPRSARLAQEAQITRGGLKAHRRRALLIRESNERTYGRTSCLE
jgi:hypothetical protein